jgi:glycosyltransferase involved in cell wall biosynthesis
MKRVIYLTALGRAYAHAGMESGADILRLVTSVNSVSDSQGWKASAVARYERPRIFTPDRGAARSPALPPAGLFSRNFRALVERLGFSAVVRAYASKLEEYGPELEQADLFHAWDAAAVLGLKKFFGGAVHKPLLFTPETGFCGPRAVWLDFVRHTALEAASALVLPGAWACAAVKDEYGYGGKCLTLPRALEDFKYLRGGRVRAELGLKETDILVSSFGSLLPEKGFGLLIDAMREGVKKMPQGLFCAIAGAGPEETALKARINSAGLGSRVKLLGFREDAGELLADSEIFVAPSLETFSDQGLIEAMRAGLAIIATGAGANPETLGWGQAGALVPAKDPAALAAKITEIASNPRELVHLSARARDFYLKNHSMRALAAGAIHLYNKAAGGGER